MKNPGRKFGSEREDYGRLRIHNNDLYWDDKKIQTEVWSRGEKLTLIGIIVGAVLTIAGIANFAAINWDKLSPHICSWHQFSFCTPLTPEPAPQPNQTPGG